MESLIIVITLYSSLIISITATTLSPAEPQITTLQWNDDITRENDAIVEAYDYINLNECNCGRRMTRYPKIINGSNAVHGNYPWMISLLLNNRHHCGGSLINSRWVLTAAHCVYHVPSSRFRVKLGSHLRSNNNTEPMSTILENVLAIAHPGFTFTTFQDDLALIRLPKAVTYTSYIQPICLPDRVTTMPIPRKATVIGWGKLKQAGISAETLQQVELPIIDNIKCINWYHEMGKMLTIRPTQICAGFEEGGKDACQGDSGSPMMITNHLSKRSTVIGVVSAGIGCALPKLPGIYTRISAYLPWIRETMQRYDGDGKPKSPFSSVTTESSINVASTANEPIDETKAPELDNLWALVSPSSLQPQLSMANSSPSTMETNNEIMESEHKKLWSLITSSLIKQKLTQ